MPNSLLTNYLCPHLSKPAWGWEACRDCFSLPPPLWPMHPSCSSCCPWLFRGKRWWAREASQLDRCRCDLAQVSLVLRTQVLPLFCKGALPRSSEHLTLGTFHSSFQMGLLPLLVGCLGHSTCPGQSSSSGVTHPHPSSLQWPLG